MRSISPATNSPLRCALLLCALLLCEAAAAADIDVIGLFPGKAVLVVDGGSPKTYSVGNVIYGGVKLIAVNEAGATFEENGKRQIIPLGTHVNRSPSSGTVSVSLKADGRGHYLTQGLINGGIIRMLLDTGATMVSISSADAVRLGIDYKKGQPVYLNTANGVTSAYRVQLNTVRVGDLELNQVDAVVQESNLPFALLGMSFLNRTEMQREGEMMTLTKRF